MGELYVHNVHQIVSLLPARLWLDRQGRLPLLKVWILWGCRRRRTGVAYWEEVFIVLPLAEQATGILGLAASIPQASKIP